MWFLIIPPVAVLFALLWVVFSSRPERTLPVVDSVEHYRKTMEALARPFDELGPGRRRHLHFLNKG